MIIDDQIKDEKLQCDINREAAKISASLSGKINKYEYLEGEEILPSNQKQIIEQARFTYSPFGKAFEKQTKTIKDQGEKQVKTIQNQGQIKRTESNKSVNNESHKIFEELSNERMSENDCIMIMLKLDLKLSTNKNMENDLKYYLLHKCFKDYLALAQVEPGNNSENLLNEIREIFYSLYQSEEITKKVYNNTVKSM